jgi:signal transduction histidine kinase
MHLVGRDELKPEEREEYLALAQTELARLSTTVQRMLNFYRPGILERKIVETHELINLVLALLEKQLLSKNIKVDKKFGKNLSKVLVDGNQIQQVFFNIILNAMEAMPEGGNLLIETKQIDATIEIYFQDSGKGVLTEDRERLFEPFYSSKKDGNGLGLSVSYGIITAHGGDLYLVEEKGTGACFCISLPSEDDK